MTPAVPSLPDASRRLQAAVALAALAGAAGLTVVLVASPVASRPAGGERAAPVFADGPRVEVTGADPLVVAAVVQRLAAEGAIMEAVQPGAGSRSGSGTTSIVYYERRHAATAARIHQILGVGRVRHEQVFQPKADVTVVLGKDR